MHASDRPFTPELARAVHIMAIGTQPTRVMSPPPKVGPCRCGRTAHCPKRELAHTPASAGRRGTNAWTPLLPRHLQGALPPERAGRRDA